MKIPKSAVVKIKDMIVNIMPYESGYTPDSKQGILITDIYNLIVEQKPDFNEWGGFVMFLSKAVDNDKDLQTNIAAIAATLADKLEEYHNEE